MKKNYKIISAIIALLLTVSGLMAQNDYSYAILRYDLKPRTLTIDYSDTANCDPPNKRHTKIKQMPEEYGVFSLLVSIKLMTGSAEGWEIQKIVADEKSYVYFLRKKIPAATP